ncbi:hypothetical protein MMC14_010511 [Varicellaria rhodocarpa]|nr:hypothetical protein [Varicellaria rhodocarpa]
MLGHLALALDQAGAYIRARNLPLKDFTAHYNRRKDVILREIPEEWEYRRVIGNMERETALSIFTTWELSFEQISVIRDWIKLRQRHSTQQQFAEELIVALTVYLQDIDSNELSLETKQETLLHIDACVQHDHELLPKLSNGSLDSRPDSVLQFAKFYYYEGRYDEAEKLYERALAGNEEQLGPKHLNTLETVETLAIVYDNQSRYDEAEKLYERALAGKEEKLGSKHPNTLGTVHNLANVYRNQNRYDEAEKLYERVLAGNEEQLGPKQPNTLLTVQNLAIVYDNQGRYDEAEKLYERVLAGNEEQLGPKHPNTLGTVENLAIVYDNQSRYNEAEKLCKRALAGNEEKLGPKHPNTLRTVHKRL